MPIYEYACRKCGKTFEYMQRMSDPPMVECEACGELALERQISQTSFHLKGSGWYKDLYSSPKPAGGSESKSEGSSAGADGGPGAGSGSTSGSSSDGGSSASTPSSASTSSAATSEVTKPGKKAKKGTP